MFTKGSRVTNVQTATKGTVIAATPNTTRVRRDDGTVVTFIGGQAKRFLRLS